ncbi:MAG: hypothetical protein LBC97_05240 [Bifidobacteriaceae bacterium]|jgi:hypothetical protein|nr:hypothetical protein [Bifidobacteriaceae bacterium]
MKTGGLAVSLAALAAALAAGCTPGTTSDLPLTSATSSPLEPYWTLAYGAAQDYAARDRLLEAAFQKRIAACVREEGFEYQIEEGRYVQEETPPAVAPGTMEYRALYGYGISSGELSGAGAAGPGTDDPNMAIRESLSAEGRAAYDLALGGEETVDADGVINRSGGCYDLAWDAVYGGAAFTGGLRWEGLLEEMTSLGDRAAASAEMAKVNGDWSACMRGKSFGALGGPDDATALADERSRSGAADAVEFEVRLAVADLECQQEVDYQVRSDQILYSLEEEFVDARKADLESWAQEAKEELAALTG